MECVVRVGDAHLRRVVDDYTIHAALHGAYQMVFHLRTINCLVEDQNIHLAGDGVFVCNGTRYDEVEEITDLLLQVTKAVDTADTTVTHSYFSLVIIWHRVTLLIISYSSPYSTSNRGSPFATASCVMTAHA
jgi:hypothetical protein